MDWANTCGSKDHLRLSDQECPAWLLSRNRGTRLHALAQFFVPRLHVGNVPLHLDFLKSLEIPMFRAFLRIGISTAFEMAE
jgi:hypothetical protein